MGQCSSRWLYIGKQELRVSQLNLVVCYEDNLFKKVLVRQISRTALGTFSEDI